LCQIPFLLTFVLSRSSRPFPSKRRSPSFVKPDVFPTHPLCPLHIPPQSNELPPKKPPSLSFFLSTAGASSFESSFSSMNSEGGFFSSYSFSLAPPRAVWPPVILWSRLLFANSEGSAPLFFSFTVREIGLSPLRALRIVSSYRWRFERIFYSGKYFLRARRGCGLFFFFFCWLEADFLFSAAEIIFPCSFSFFRVVGGPCGPLFRIR